MQAQQPIIVIYARTFILLTRLSSVSVAMEMLFLYYNNLMLPIWCAVHLYHCYCHFRRSSSSAKIDKAIWDLPDSQSSFVRSLSLINTAPAPIRKSSTQRCKFCRKFYIGFTGMIIVDMIVDLFCKLFLQDTRLAKIFFPVCAICLDSLEY